MLIIPSCAKWLIWMLRIKIKIFLNYILSFGFSKKTFEFE
jgi:hypothetical protein